MMTRDLWPNHRPNRWIVLAPLIALGIALSCSKDSQGGVNRVPPVVAGLPKTINFVVGISPAQLAKTKLWEQLTSVIGQGKDLDEVKATCGIDPIGEMDLAILAGESIGKGSVVLAKGKWNRERAEKCLPQLVEKMGGKVTVEQQNKVSAYRFDDGKSIYGAWLDNNTLMLPNPPGDKNVLLEMLDAKQKLKDNKDLLALFGEIDAKSTAWAVGMLKGSELASVAAEHLGAAPEALYLEVTIKDSVAVKAGLRFENDKQAKAAAAALGRELTEMKSQPLLAGFVGEIKVKSSSKDAVVSLSLTKEKVDQLVNQYKAMMMLRGLVPPSMPEQQLPAQQMLPPTQQPQPQPPAQ
ncbi:MAG: hypothetical protein V2A73_15105 [Pseudomonadota bacterium]